MLAYVESMAKVCVEKVDGQFVELSYVQNGWGEICGRANADFKPNMSGTPFPIPAKTITIGSPTADQESEELEIENDIWQMKLGSHDNQV